MSEAPGGGHLNDLVDLAFDPSGSDLPPPLRPPLLNSAQLQAALQLGFSDKCIPSGVVANGGGNPYYQNPSDFGSNYSGGGGAGYFQGSQYSQGDCTEGAGHFTREQEGLLDPLRRPDVTQIPPDVLAVLIKTGRFQEILGQDQRQQSQPHSARSIPDSRMNQDSRISSRNVNSNQNNRSSPLQQQQAQERNYSGNPPQQQPRAQERNYSTNPQQQSQVQECNYSAHPPHQQSHTQERNYSTTPPRNPNQRNPATGTPSSGPTQQRFRATPPQSNEQKIMFSPHAKEFRPQAPQTNAGMNFQGECELAEAVAQIQMLNHNQSNSADYPQSPYSSQSGNESDNNDNMDCILSTVTDAITDLTLYPANFNRCAKTMTEVLKNYLRDTDTLGVAVTLLVEQSISNPNFCYSGARLSQVLHKRGVAVAGTTFKHALLLRCQEEFKHCIANIQRDEETLIRCRGLLMFFGELYVNLRIETTGGVAIPISVLGLGVIEMMQKLVKDPSYDNVKSVFQVLKLVGWDLEKSTESKVTEEFEKLVKDLSYIRCRPVDIESRTKSLLDTMFDLMSKNWNREPAEESTKTPVSSSPASSTYGSNHVYEMPESDEEDYDETGLMLDDEPAEVQKAYDEFLKMGKRK